jgi:hypothetical protein
MSGSNLAEMISSKCPRLIELDLCGTKTLHLPNILFLLDAKWQQVQYIYSN